MTRPADPNSSKDLGPCQFVCPYEIDIDQMHEKFTESYARKLSEDDLEDNPEIEGDNDNGILSPNGQSENPQTPENPEKKGNLDDELELKSQKS